MKRVVALLVIAVCAVWSVLLLGPRRKERTRAPREATAEVGAATGTAQAPTPSAQRARTTTASKPASSGVAPSASKASGAHASTASARSPGSSASAVSQAARTAFAERPPSEVAPAEGTGELGEGVMSPDYVEMESTFMQEPREGAWAIQHEVKIRELFYASDIAERVVL